MANTPMPEVELLGVDFVEALHAQGKSWQRCLDQQVVMIRHQHPGVQQPSLSMHDTTEELEKELAIGVAAGNVAALVAASRDMPDGAGMFESQRPGQTAKAKSSRKLDERRSPLEMWATIG